LFCTNPAFFGVSISVSSGMLLLLMLGPAVAG
jgi:hypothetical protein